MRGIKHIASIAAKGFTVCGKPMKDEYKFGARVCPKCARTRPKQISLKDEFERL
jgi:hypothetical protein